MKKLIALFICAALAASALNAFALNENTTAAASDAAYSWYLEPGITADDMTVLYNYQGCYETEDNAYFYDTIDRMHLGRYTPFEIDGKWGLIDYKGNIGLAPQFDKLETAAGRDDYVGVNKKQVGDREIYSDETTLTESDGVFREIAFYDGMLGTNGKTRRAFYWLPDEEKAYVGGMQAYAGEYNIGDLTFAAQIGVKKDMGGEYVTAKGKNVVDPENPDVVLVSDGQRVDGVYYTDGGCFSEGLIAMCQNDMWGYVNEKGETVIPFELDPTSSVDYSYSLGWSREMAYEASNGYVSVCMGGLYALFDTSGNLIMDYGDFDKILPVYSDGKDKLAWVNYRGSWGVIKINEPSDGTESEDQPSDPKASDDEPSTDQPPEDDKPKFRQGDVNRDRYITAKDSLLVSRRAIGLLKLDEEQFSLADIDRDGRVTNKDALYILRYTIGHKVKGM